MPHRELFCHDKVFCVSSGRNWVLRAFSDGASRTNAFVPTKMTQFQLARDWHFQLTEKTSSTLFITVFCTNYRINTVRNINPMFAVQEIQALSAFLLLLLFFAAVSFIVQPTF